MASRMMRMSQLDVSPSASSLRRSHSMETYMVRVYLGPLSQTTEFVAIEGLKNTRADEIVEAAVHKLRLGIPSHYELAETFSSGGQLCKERRLDTAENPVRIQLLWPRITPHMADIHRTEYQFYLRKREPGVARSTSWMEYNDNNRVDSFLSTFLQQPKNKEYPDLCNLPDLNETTLLQNLKSRFDTGCIYTYVGSILISVNPFKFYPIYNPKYVKMYQNRRLGDLPPHIFAIADAAYYTMLHEKRNQCIVISGESGSGKTESTNLLLHHLSALSQRGHHGTGVEQTILGAGPVLEAFGNAKTVHNNNSSRFGKFIQVNYKENGMVHGAIVEKYLLEKSRIVSQAANERNYHVFYYLLAGASEQDRESFNLSQPQDFFYLNQSECYQLEGIDGEAVDEGHEFIRLKQSMEMVGFSNETQRRIFSVLAAVLHLGNVEYKKKADHRHHEAVTIMNPNTINLISTLLKVKEATLLEALTKKKTTAGGETVVMNYNMADALATRDAMAKCLYGGLFDWIVLQVNHALLSKKDIRDHQGNYIGVLDIFGFEDFRINSFEQFCINYANESLHYYFNQHIFKFEQEEYVREGIQWKNIEFIDNTLCLSLFAKKPTGLLFLLDEECNFPGATNETLLAKFHAQHQNHEYYEMPQMRESAFSIVHYAGKVKYSTQDFREKNSDFIRQDIMLVLKNSNLSFVRELVGYDPVAVLRWAIVRAFFRAYFAFIDAGKRHRKSAGKVQASSNKFAAILRQQSPSQREAARMSFAGDMSGSRKVIIVEKPPSRHASYHGDMHRFYGDQEDETDVDTLNTSNGEVPMSPKSPNSAQNGLSPDGFIHRNKAMKRANRVMMKSKSFKPKTRSTKGLRDLKSMKTLAGKTVVCTRGSKGKNKPPSVSAQFNHSLSKLMDTLNQANPFFIRCIKSNADKAPCRFNEDIVLRQLRYTGMLATVKIRQSGYNYRLTFEEFIQQYKILLPKGLVSSKGDVNIFLQQLDLNTENYQIGKTKVFLRETEKLLLDDTLHRAIMTRIINIQRWMKATLDRRRYVRMKCACVIIQTKVRGFLAQRHLHRLRVNFYAALLIQKAFRGFKARQRLKKKQSAACVIQKHVRGYLDRHKVLVIKEEAAKRREEEKLEHEKELQRQAEEFEKERLKRQQAEEEEVRLKKEEEAKRLAQLDILEKERQKLSLTKMEEVKMEREKERWNVVEVDVSKDKQRRQTSEEEESRTDGRDGLDLHSSASDEGVLTKDSSTEDLIERGNIPQSSNGHESESSGILDDSESEVTSLGTSGRTTPPSAPQSPWVTNEAPVFPVVPQAGSTPMRPEDKPGNRSRDTALFQPAVSPVQEEAVKGIRRSERHTVGPSPRAQEGPRDLEVVIRPAVQKSASVDSAFHNEACAADVWVDKQIHAPLAKQESLNESMLDEAAKKPLPDLVSDAQSMTDSQSSLVVLPPDTYSLSSDQDDGRRMSQGLIGETLSSVNSLFGANSEYSFMHGVVPPPPTSPVEEHFRAIKEGFDRQMDSGAAAQGEDTDTTAHLSPFHRAKKHLKNFVSDGGGGKTKEAWGETSQLKVHKKRRKGSKKRYIEEKIEQTNAATWSVSSTSQWQYPDKKVIQNAVELMQLDTFVSCKIASLDKDNRRDTVFDKVFKRALREFYSTLITSQSVAHHEFNYKDLMCNYEETLKACARNENLDDSFPVTMGINAFRGFLDEFIKKKENKELPKIEVKKEKKKKEKDKEIKEHIVEHMKHKFLLTQFGIPTFCEMCNHVMWRGYVCQVCKSAVHKKCCSKFTSNCKAVIANRKPGHEKHMIGMPLSLILKDNEKVPTVMERMIKAIELNGLFTVGVYRKAGAAGKIRELLHLINTDGENVDFTEYHVHVLTSVMKTFFRELPEPLLTYDLYDDFIRASECKDEKERVQTLYDIVRKLPTPNYDLFERLVFHLANVAQHESLNKMSSNGIAIIFAPTVLRSSRDMPAQESLLHVPKQTICLDSIIGEQLKKIRHSLADILTLDTAAASATDRLSVVRASMRNGTNKPKKVKETEDVPPAISESDDDEKIQTEARILSEQIRSLQQEKEQLTINMPNLECRHSSSEEDILSTDDLDSVDDPDAGPYEEYAITFDLPAMTPPKNMRYLNKRRAHNPTRRLPSKRHMHMDLEGVTSTTGVADIGGAIRRRLSVPELKQIGEAILV